MSQAESIKNIMKTCISRDKKPKVSVVLAVYNHEQFVGQTIESIIGQSFEDWELIIIDDCPIMVPQTRSGSASGGHPQRRGSPEQTGFLRYRMTTEGSVFIRRKKTGGPCGPSMNCWKKPEESMWHS